MAGVDAPDSVLTILFLAVAAAAAVDVVDVVERTEVDDVERFAIGLSFAGSTGGTRFALVDVVAVELGRERTALGDDVAVVLTLMADTVDATEPRRVRPLPTVLGERSDLAVSNAVDTSLVVVEVDMVEDGRASPEGGRSEEGPAIVLRIVDAVEWTDLTEALAEDFGRG